MQERSQLHLKSRPGQALSIYFVRGYFSQSLVIVAHRAFLAELPMVSAAWKVASALDARSSCLLAVGEWLALWASKSCNPWYGYVIASFLFYLIA